VPLLVCAPTTAIDLATASGEEATIEEGRPNPVLHAGTTRVAPEGSQVRNPIQDLTPASFVAVLVTEEGVLRAPFGPAIAEAAASASTRRAASPGFAALVQAVFTRRRKTLANALQACPPVGPRSTTAPFSDVLARAGLDGSRRPETLTVAEFVRLSDCFPRRP
jgi:hypothetical protein